MSLVGSLVAVAVALAAEPPPRRVPRASVGPDVGATFSLSKLGASLAPGVQGTVVLDRGGRIEAVLSLGTRGGHAEGAGTDPAVGTYTWSLGVQSLDIRPGVHLRILPWNERISPVLAVGPLIGLGVATSAGTAAGVTLPATEETWVGLGGWARAGIAGHVGPGSLEVGVGFSARTCDAAIVGIPALLDVTPTILYRFER